MSVFETLCKGNDEWVKVKESIDKLTETLAKIEEDLHQPLKDEYIIHLKRYKNGVMLALNNAKKKLDVIEDDILVNYTNTYNTKALGYDCGITSDEYYEHVFDQNGLFKGIKF